MSSENPVEIDQQRKYTSSLKKFPGGHAKLSDIFVSIKSQTTAVEKRKIKTGLLILSFLLAISCSAQKLHMVKGYCGIYYYTMEDLLRQKQAELDFYQFRPGQVVASIGAQCGHWEAAYAAATDSVLFYLEDIDTSFFNARQVSFAWHYYDSLRGRPMTCRYTLVTGTTASTGLPEGVFDKILIINSFHEFSEKAKMLADLKAKLKPGGILYIDESVPRKPGQLHGVCKMPMLSPEEMTSLLAANGFAPAGTLDINFRLNRTYRKIYAFILID